MNLHIPQTLWHLKSKFCTAMTKQTNKQTKTQTTKKPHAKPKDTNKKAWWNKCWLSKYFNWLLKYLCFIFCQKLRKEKWGIGHELVYSSGRGARLMFVLFRLSFNFGYSKSETIYRLYRFLSSSRISIHVSLHSYPILDLIKWSKVLYHQPMVLE